MTRKVGGDTSNFLPNSMKKLPNAATNAPNVAPSSFVTTMNNAANAVKSLSSNTIATTANNAVKKVNTATDAAVNTAMNAVNSAKTSLVNTFGPFAKENVLAPIQESINGSFESETSPFVSIPIMIGLGLLVIALILIVIFRDQVSYGLEVAWQKLKVLFSSPTPPAPKDEKKVPAMPAMPAMIDKAAIGNMLPGQREVFNIADNKYKYSDAEPLCKAFGAELATYDQVKEAWKKGADWCNYGWVKGQSAVYPTQQSTYDKLQAGPEDQRMACGAPGVNGGYFDNPELRFGVNCYGARPAQTDTDFRHIMQQEGNRTQGALEYDKKVQDFKVHRDQIPVNPFHSA